MLELRQTVRRLWRAPGFTFTTVLTLAVGIARRSRFSPSSTASCCGRYLSRRARGARARVDGRDSGLSSCAARVNSNRIGLNRPPSSFLPSCGKSGAVEQLDESSPTIHNAIPPLDFRTDARHCPVAVRVPGRSGPSLDHPDDLHQLLLREARLWSPATNFPRFRALLPELCGPDVHSLWPNFQQPRHVALLHPGAQEPQGLVASCV